MQMLKSSYSEQFHRNFPTDARFVENTGHVLKNKWTKNVADLLFKDNYLI